ncbi:MAG: shikimate kinase, partial [Candidatus Geothermarchaeales archaeon]
MRGRAVAHGAITIVNAIASYKGAALGIDLKTTAEVELIEGGDEIEVEIVDHPDEDRGLAVKAVEAVFERFGVEGLGARVRTWSDIPIAKGLKSSSVASNAIVLAATSALGRNLEDLAALNMGVEASIRAGVSITGAFDDASASYFGGVVVTDNLKRMILRREKLPSGLRVLLYTPPGKVYTVSVDTNRLRSLG